MRPPVLGSLTALAAFVVDQGHKLWMLNVLDIETRQPLHVTPFLDLIMAWNTGISYSLLRADTPAARGGLLVLAVVAMAILGFWLLRTTQRITAVALGLIIGGALGNACDRFVHGAVADFFRFHLGSYSWYIFNLADVAIVAGAALLLYESLFTKQKRGDGVPAS